MHWCEWLTLANYVVTNAFAPSSLCSRLKGLLLWHIFMMHLSPFLGFEDSAVEDVCRCVSMLLNVRHFFPYYCHVTILFCGQRCYFRVCDYSWHWCLDSWLVYDCLDSIASNILTSLLISCVLPHPPVFPHASVLACCIKVFLRYLFLFGCHPQPNCFHFSKMREESKAHTMLTGHPVSVFPSLLRRRLKSNCSLPI